MICPICKKETKEKQGGKLYCSNCEIYLGDEDGFRISPGLETEKEEVDPSPPYESTPVGNYKKPFIIIFKKLIKIIFLISVVLFVFSYFQKNKLPIKGEIMDSLYREPLQTELQMEPFKIQKKESTYTIIPRYDYELYGLVVSQYDSENWFDFWHKGDPLNTKDACTVWGDNIKSDVYQKMKFSHGEFTCYAEFKPDIDYSWYSKFSSANLSNNHLLPGSEEIYNEIKKVTIGDQIYFKGYLVDYTVDSQNGRSSRNTSTVRTDDKCEIVYVTDFQILKKGNPIYYLINRISGYLVIFSFIILILLFFRL
jgi:hypothetical protein